MASGLKTQSFIWNLGSVSPGKGYWVKVMAKDGFNTDEDISDAPFTIRQLNYLPMVTGD